MSDQTSGASRAVIVTDHACANGETIEWRMSCGGLVVAAVFTTDHLSTSEAARRLIVLVASGKSRA